MFPYPINTLGRLIAEVSAVKIAAEEKAELHPRAVGVAQLRHFHRLFLAALIGVREVAGGFRLEEERKLFGLHFLRHDDGVDRDVDGLNAAFELNRHVRAKAEGARRHGVETGAVTRRELFVVAGFEPGFNGGDLSLLLCVANNWIRNGATKPVSDDRRRPMSFGLCRGCFPAKPHEDIRVCHLLDDVRDLGKLAVDGRGRHLDRQFLVVLHSLDHAGGHAGEADETVYRQGRTGGHAQRRENFRVQPDHRRLNVQEVVGREECRFNVVGGLEPRVAEGRRCEFHKPGVVHVHRSGDIGFPLLRLVEINGHEEVWGIGRRSHIKPSLANPKFNIREDGGLVGGKDVSPVLATILTSRIQFTACLTNPEVVP